MKGKIVLTAFPFTDLEGVKRRPALVLTNLRQQHSDVIVAFISSVIPTLLAETDVLLHINDPVFASTGLRRNSIIKVDKLATLDISIFSGELGDLEPSKMLEVQEKLKILFNL
jgi:mRNA interferase MazF